MTPRTILDRLATAAPEVTRRLTVRLPGDLADQLADVAGRVGVAQAAVVREGVAWAVAQLRHQLEGTTPDDDPALDAALERGRRFVERWAGNPYPLNTLGERSEARDTVADLVHAIDQARSRR
ncbi:MAG: hypothetical protein S0880_07405 [Actinomycetota bacterium]|nr:hypothetical protein [Actinomycetota bacterium]